MSSCDCNLHTHLKHQRKHIKITHSIQKASVYNNLTCSSYDVIQDYCTGQGGQFQVQWTLRRIISGGHLEIKTDFTYTVSNAISQEKPNELPTFWRTKHYLQNLQNIFFILLTNVLYFLKTLNVRKQAV